MLMPCDVPLAALGLCTTCLILSIFLPHSSPIHGPNLHLPTSLTLLQTLSKVSKQDKLST
jgi:hypothetical protein